RFALAIDEAAMRDGADSTDDYLADWHRGDPVECSDELEVEARRVAERLEAEFDGKLLAELINSGGRAG
ncbi:MAG: virulence factor, partial [Candidatus Puniceispirillaceae bacterium]